VNLVKTITKFYCIFYVFYKFILISRIVKENEKPKLIGEQCWASFGPRPDSTSLAQRLKRPDRPMTGQRTGRAPAWSPRPRCVWWRDRRRPANGFHMAWSVARESMYQGGGGAHRGDATLMRWQRRASAATSLDEGLRTVVGVTPRVSKPHDYVNHMFMRL
jgi:hypothetical protein